MSSANAHAITLPFGLIYRDCVMPKRTFVYDNCLMKCVLLVILTFSATHVLFAQKFPGIVRGTVQDSATALMDATVSVIKTADSSFVAFTLTDKNGSFEIKNLDTASYLLVV